MKKMFTLLALVPFAATAFGQAITITSTDMPVPTTYYILSNFSTSTAANPAVATSTTWDYSTYIGTPDTIAYVTETDTFFTHAGVDVYRLGFKTLSSSTGLGYGLYGEYDFNTSNVQESGIFVPAQNYGLGSFTSTVTDSIFVPQQSILLSTPRKIINFPFTANSSWSSSSRRAVNLNLTVSSAMLSNAPAQHVYYVNRKDTIVGWGKMKVYTTHGTSIQYDVLMDKISEYSADSFYLGGSSSSMVLTGLLSALGVSQGQKNDSNNRYNFYRKGTFSYLLSYYYGNDNSYSSATAGKYVDTRNVTPAGVEETGNIAYSTVLFPNPANSSEINLMVSGKDVTNGNYTITDMAGKTVQAGAIEMKQGAVHVALTAIANGNYVINVTDNENNKVATEQFTVAK